MRFFGLHIFDLLIVLAFVTAVLGAGFWSSRSVKHEGDYYLGGRKLGKVLQFFLSFGNMTDTTGAAQTVGQVVRYGMGGAWLGLQTLFITPFFWFMPVWFRRVRLVTMADLFVDRFNSHALATAYVLFGVLAAFQSLAVSGVISYKVVAALAVKPEAAWTDADKKQVADFAEFRKLKTEYESGTLAAAGKARFVELESRAVKGEIKDFISYVSPAPFMIGYMLLAGIYITMGGFRAAAISDAIEGSLILLFTIGLITMGLIHVGGLSGLHATVPDYRFQLFGTGGTSNIAWYTVIAITFTSLIQIFGMAPNMANSGSAENEFAARFGMITGAFSKRIVTSAWAVCGIIALSLFGNRLADPDSAWGFLSTALLVPGLMGLMLAAMVVGRMANVGANSLTVSALIVRNVYEPLARGRSPGHYVFMGKVVIVIVLSIGIMVGVFFSTSRVDTLYTTLVTLNAFYGAVVLLIFFWRKLTAPAIGLSLVVWLVLMVVVSWILPQFEGFRRHQPLLARTIERTETEVTEATKDDVAAGRATAAGETITRTRVIRPAPLYFEKIVKASDGAGASIDEGGGRFKYEVYLLKLLGVPVERFPGAALTASVWAVDGVLPFLMLIPLSYLTAGQRNRTRRPALVHAGDGGVAVLAEPDVTDAGQHRIDGFYAKLKTPVARTPEEDRHEVALSYANPHRFDHEKLFPNSNWEFTRWRRDDWRGFVACWIVVALILAGLWLVLNLGK